MKGFVVAETVVDYTDNIPMTTKVYQQIYATWSEARRKIDICLDDIAKLPAKRFPGADCEVRVKDKKGTVDIEIDERHGKFAFSVKCIYHYSIHKVSCNLSLASNVD